MSGSRETALLAIVLLVSACRADGGRASNPPIRVAAAADLAAAFAEIGHAFERDTGQRVSFSFGSTGLFAKQIEEGAPFDLFAAASVSYVDEVVAAGVCDAATKTLYARGRLAIWTSRGAAKKTTAPPQSIAELAEARFRRIAIANPEHAPYGVAAREALVAAGIWEQVRSRMVYGENVRQALQLAETGNVEAAIVALALVIRKDDGAWSLVDENLHRPIDQALVSCRRGGRFAGGRAFATFLVSETGREMMRRYGFSVPPVAPGVAGGTR
ncbi:MAG: molybdate ABC transporter substrate-binding protein [Pseudomonadota bacterium]